MNWLLFNRRMIKDLSTPFAFCMALIFAGWGLAGMGVCKVITLGDELDNFESWLFLIIGVYFMGGFVVDKVIRIISRRKKGV